MTTRPLSPTALDRFLECPRRFEHQDVRRKHFEFEPSSSWFAGVAMHAALKHLFERPACERNPDRLEAALRDWWREKRKQTPFVSVEEEIYWGRYSISRLRSYAERTDLAARTIGVERELHATLGGGARITGRLDRIDLLDSEEGLLEVIDYKTGKRRLDSSDLPNDSGARYYLLLAEKNLGPVARVRHVYLASEDELVWEPERDDLPHIEAAVAADIDGINLTSVYQAQPGIHCNWCPFRALCEASEARNLASTAASTAAPVVMRRR